MAKTKKTKKTKTTKRGNVFYIMSPSCGWCKKADPIVEELKSDGYEITTIDVTTPEGSKQSNEIKQKYNVQCGTPLFLEESTGENACGFREKDVMTKWLDGEPLPEPPRPKSPMPRPPFMNAPDGDLDKWKKEYTKWAKENDHLPGIKSADDILKQPRPKSQPPNPPSPTMTSDEQEMWALEWDEWALENKHLPGLQPSEQLLARFKPQWEAHKRQLENEVNSKKVKLPDSGFYYFFSPQCAFCTETSKQVNKLIKDGHKVTKKDTSIPEDSDFQKAILYKFGIQCGTPMLVDLKDGNYLCGAQPDKNIDLFVEGKSVNKSNWPPIPPGVNASDKQIEEWTNKFNDFSKNNPDRKLPSAEEYYQQYLTRKKLVEENKSLLNAGTPTSIENNPNVTTRHIGGNDAVGMATHDTGFKWNKRWYYHVLEPGKRTMIQADTKYIESMQYQYLWREADGSHTKVIGDQWLQNDLLQKHKEFKDDKESMKESKLQREKNLQVKTKTEVENIAKKSVSDSKKIKKNTQKVEELNKKNKHLTSQKGDIVKDFSSDVKKAISDMKSEDSKEETKSIPGF